jgi:hypothetical protein
VLRAMLSAQKELYANRRIDAYDLALTYCLLGDKQHALDLLQNAVTKREARATSVRVEHNLQPQHDDPSFRKLVAQVGHEKRSCHLAPRAHSELALGGGDVFGIVELGFDVGDIALREIVE